MIITVAFGNGEYSIRREINIMKIQI